MSSAIGNGGAESHSSNGEMPPQQMQPPDNGGQTLVLVQTQPEGHSFWSHIFSFEHVARPHQPPPATPPAPPTQTAVWLSALKSMKLSSLFEGLDATPNFKFLALMAAFLGWLFVVYWVRQYELVNTTKVSSTPPIFTIEQIQPDRVLVNRLKMAYPGSNPQNSTIGMWQGAYAQPIEPGPGQALSASSNSIERFGQPLADIAVLNVTDASSCSAAEPVIPSEPIPSQLPILGRTNGLRYQQSNESFLPPAYNIQVRSATGPRLKTIANR